jgi:signal transduction histidine kinase/uncharacterized protein YigA (DUF484 family)
MTHTDNKRPAASQVKRLRAQVSQLEQQRDQAQEILARLERLGQSSLSWDGTPGKLSNLASQIRQALDYKTVAISLFEGDILHRRVIAPPDAQIHAEWSTDEIEQAMADNQPSLVSNDQKYLFVPLIADAQRVGAIEIDLDGSSVPRAVELWRVLKSQIASTIVSGQLVTRARLAQQREWLLHDITRHLTSGLSLSQMLGDVLALTIPCVDADDGSIMLLDEHQQVTDRILLRKELSHREEQQAIQSAIDHGLAGWILKHKQPAIIQDARTDERWIQLTDQDDNIRSVLSVPLQRGDRIRGLLLLVHHEPDHFDNDHVSFLTSVADQTAIAAENAYLFEQTQQRLKELALINEISQATSSLHLNDVLRIVTQRIVEALQVRRCAVFLLDEDKKHLVLRAVHNPDVTNDNMNLVVSLGDRPHIAGALEMRSPIEIQDVFADDRLRYFWDKAHELNIQSQLAVPLITQGRVIGAISIDRGEPTPQFSEGELNLCQTIAHQAANAIENARLYEEVQNRAERMWLANMVSHDIGTQLDIHQLLWEVVRLIRETFDCYYVAVALIEDDELTFRSGINYLYQTTPKASFSLRGDEQSIAGWVAQRGRPVLVPDVRDDPRYRMRPGLEDIRSQLAVPLKVLERSQGQFEALDQVIGVLDVGSTEIGAFSMEDQQLLEALAAQVSVAIENARLFGRIQEERATLEAIINGTGDAIITTDTADRVLFFNPAAQRAFRNGEHVQPGTPLSEAVDNEALRAFWQSATQNETNSAEIPLPDGRTFHTSITTVTEVGKVAVMQDITYLKELDAMKSEFVSTVSHDLRSPLQVIQTSAELLPRLGEVNQEQRREIDHILAIVRRISDLVQNLLDIGRIEAGVGMDIEPCAIDEIIARAAGSCRSLAQGKGLDFSVDLPRALPLVQGDPVRLDQVIANLVSNAIKFTPEGSVAVAAWSEDKWVVIEVRDSGIGIPAEAQKKLFQKFYRVKSPETRGIQGTGLGLAIVKSIIESYGGQIKVQSFPRLGSVFTVMLPVYQEAMFAAD